MTETFVRCTNDYPNGTLVRTFDRRSCPMLGCLEKRKGIFCGRHWSMTPHHFRRSMLDAIDTQNSARYAERLDAAQVWLAHYENALGFTGEEMHRPYPRMTDPRQLP